MHEFGYGWGMGFVWIIGIIILLIILWLAFKIFRSNSEQSSISQKTPLDILKERYAKGEIDKEEFEQRKKDLEN